MFIQNKGFTGEYFKATGKRIEKIRNIQDDCDEAIERLFGITNINKFTEKLENELFFEIIPMSASQKLFNTIIIGVITKEQFKEEYKYSAIDGFISFCTMLDIL